MLIYYEKATDRIMEAFAKVCIFQQSSCGAVVERTFFYIPDKRMGRYGTISGEERKNSMGGEFFHVDKINENSSQINVYPL